MPKDTLYNEERLLLQVAAGDEEAFASLYRYYQPRLHLYIYPFADASKELTEEIVQDVFVRIWMRKEALPAIQSFAQYLFRMARNRLYDVQSKQQKLDESLHAVGQQNDQLYSPVADTIILNDYKSIARNAIAALSEQKQRIFRLRFEQDQTLDQIAETLGIAKTTVKKQLYKAIREVRQELKDRGGIGLPMVLLV